MNDESLDRVNRFLAAVGTRTQVGEVMAETPAEIGRELGFPDPLSTARAVRALIARQRLAPSEGSYRLVDLTPVEADEKESLARPARRSEGRRAGRRAFDSATGYSDVGRAAVDKLIELGQDAARLRAELRGAREELRSARAARDEAEQRARSLGERIGSLEHRAEMAESNLRSLLAAARGREARPDTPVGDAEMAAILGVLRGDEEPSQNTAGDEQVD